MHHFIELALREKQAAELLNVSISFLRADRLSGSPKVPFARIGRSVRYSASELQNLLTKK